MQKIIVTIQVAYFHEMDCLKLEFSNSCRKTISSSLVVWHLLSLNSTQRGEGGGALLWWAIQEGSAQKGRESFQKTAGYFSIRKGYKISFKVKEMVAKVKYIKECHILAEATMQLNQND